MNKCLLWKETFGLLKNNSSESTLWIGSPGAYTQLHYDTYSSNLIAQIIGIKKWILFPPSSSFLDPTRIPYEESSVYSNLHISSVQSKGIELVLKQGEILYLPKHWWHYVECLDASLSINLWINEKSDDYDRLKEAIVSLLLTSLKKDESPANWLNPNQEIVSYEENIYLLQESIRQINNKLVTKEKLLQILVDSDIIDKIAEKLLNL